MDRHDLYPRLRAALLAATAICAMDWMPLAHAAAAPQPDLNTRLSKLEADVQRLLKQNPGAATEVIPGSSTDMETRILAIERAIEQLTGQVEETRFKADRSADELKVLNDDVNLRLATIEQALGITPGAAAQTAPTTRPRASAQADEGAARAAAARNAAAMTPDSPLSQPINVPRPAPAPEPVGGGVISESNVPPVNPLAGDRGTVDANGGFVVRTDANGRPLPADPNAAVAPPPQTAKAEPPPPVPRAAPAAPSVTGNQLASIPPSDVALPNGTPKQQYDYAFDFLKRNDYARGEAALRQFLQKNPKDPLAGNAQYWLGETFYVRGDYQNAAKEFMAGYQTYPKGGKGPDNLLKLGLSLEKLNQNPGACTAFGRITKDYPDASDQVKAQVKTERAKLKCS
jgi:tol-pal system protein YbgF